MVKQLPRDPRVSGKQSAKLPNEITPNCQTNSKNKLRPEEIYYLYLKYNSMELTLRLERPSDHRETENVTREAFWSHYTPGCMEHYLLNRMRDYPDFVPGLDVVALLGDKIVGNIIYAKAHVQTADGNRHEVLSLGPISVLPEYQHRGIGKRLIEYTKRRAGELGYRAILLYGDPDYYGRRGFRPAEELGIRTADNMYAAALQVCELYENALSGMEGRYFEGAIYEIDEAAALEFDKGFPPKERISGTSTQKRFEELSGMRREAEDLTPSPAPRTSPGK